MAGDLTGFAGQRVLVTGGSRGLGADIVSAFAQLGASVAFTYRSSESAANDLVSALRSSNLFVAAYCADVSDHVLAQRVLKQVVTDIGGVDVLVCNAGSVRSGALWKLSEDDWDHVVGVTLKGSFNYIHAAAPYLMKQRYGRIVCIGSINGLRGRVGTASYNVAKAGLTGLVKSAAAELGPYGITANVVAPGFIETSSQAGTSELIRHLVVSESALKRLGTSADILPLIVFLASEQARHITGQTIKVDAGQYL